MDNELVVTGICGSLRDGSYTRIALKIALQGAEESGATTKLIDLRNYDLAFCDGRFNDETYPEDVSKLKEEVGESHGIILGTPEYHSGYSGVLKNALDLMGFDEFGGKMVGLLGVAGGSMGATNALNGLRTIGRSLHAWVIPDQVSIPQAGTIFDESGNIKDDKLNERIKDLGKQVTKFALLHNFGKSQEFLQEWEVAPVNPGGATKKKE